MANSIEQPHDRFTPGNAGGFIHVLIVEDEPFVADVLKDLLAASRPYEFSYYLARNLAEAFASLREKHIDVVLLDLGLPDSRGVQTASSVRKRRPERQAGPVRKVRQAAEQMVRCAHLLP